MWLTVAASGVADAAREWLVAIGTLGAAGAAIYVGVIRNRLRRPVLSLHYDPSNRTDAQVVGMKMEGHPKGGTRAAFARLRVRNAEGKFTAEEVQLLVGGLRLVELGRDPTPDSENIGELPLAVSSSDPTVVHVNLPPGVERHFDFVHIRKDQIEGGSGYINLDVHPPPADLRAKIRARRIEVDVIVTSRNADARGYTVAVEFDGRWPDDEQDAFRHMRVEAPRALG